MLLALLLILAESRVTLGTPLDCPTGYSVSLAKIQESAFLDPSDENRTKLTRQIVDTHFMQWKKETAPTASSRSCLEMTIRRASVFSDDEILDPTLADYARSYTDAWKQNRSALGATSSEAASTLAAIQALTQIRPRPFAHLPVRMRAQRLDQARESCAARPDSRLCTVDLLATVVLNSNDVTAQRLLDAPALGYATDVRRWRVSSRNLKGNRERVALALGEPLENSSLGIREWAIDTLLGSMDPRKWDPADVALVIHELQGNPKKDAQIGRIRISGVDPDQEWRSTVFKKLLPMGALRVLELVGDAPGLPDPASLSFRHPSELEHYEGEFHLYTQEWLAREGKTRVSDEDLKVSFEYVAQRWRQTDEAAPHPEVGAVRDSLQQLRRSEPAVRNSTDRNE